MRKLLVVPVVALATLVVAGCATIMTGSEQKLFFDSKPEGAEVVINGVSVGKTPLQIKYKREPNVNVTVRAPGYKDHTFTVQHDFNPWFWGNFITGGLLGSTTDSISGATVRYSPDHYFSTLEPITASVDDRAAREHQVVKFVLLNHAQLAAEVHQGEGERLDALLTLTRVQDRAAAIAELRVLFASEARVPDVAQSVAARFTA